MGWAFLLWNLLLIPAQLTNAAEDLTSSTKLISKQLNMFPSPDYIAEYAMNLEEKNKQPSKNNNDAIDPRIVGGNNANPSRYPYYTLVLVLDDDGTPISQCGGSVVHEDYVLCAAHCWTASGAGITVIANYTQYVPSLGATGYEQQRDGVKLYYHPDHFVGIWGIPFNDFLLIKVDRPFDDIHPVHMNRDSDFPTVGTSLTVVGFGVDHTEGSAPMRLNEVDIDVISQSNCNDMDSFFSTIIDSMLCAGDEGGKVSSPP